MYLKKSIFATIFSCLSLFAFGQQLSATLPVSRHDFIVIAHRGSHLVKPENTIAAVEEAIQLGADYVEIDLRTTKDGYLVLSHNEAVDQQTNGKGKVRNLKLEEVQKLVTNSKDGMIHRIPVFSEVLKVCKNRINIYLDFKDADVEQTYKEIKAAGMEKQIMVYLNKAGQGEEWKRIAPVMPLMAGLPGNIRTAEELKIFLQKAPIQATDRLDNPALINALKENGVSVFLDVQNAIEDPVRWDAALRKGVQGLQTDHPAALIQYLKDHQLRNDLKAKSDK